jgi:hypothetical protein
VHAPVVGPAGDHPHDQRVAGTDPAGRRRRADRRHRPGRADEPEPELVDDDPANFQFGCEAAWRIERGRRAGMLRSPIYTGSTPAFWGGCDAIGGPAAWRIWGLASCGKGDPVQSMGVAHGCAPARFRNVQVGASR